MNDIVSIILIVLTIIASALFSASEIASAKSNKLRLNKASEDGDKLATLIVHINDDYTRLLSTILAGNNFVNIAATSLMTVLMIAHFGAKRGELLASVLTTVLLLIFGETLPKIIAAAVPDKAMRLFAYPLRFCMIVLYPIIWLVSKFVDALSKLWTPKETEPTMTTEELCEILEDIEDEGVFTENKTDLIRSAIEFTEVHAYEILTPRVNIDAIDIEDFEEEDIEELCGGHSRVPVYEDTIDNIIGILPVKALLKEIATGKKNINIKPLLTEPIFVHETCSVTAIMALFKEKHDKVAVVVDEFGGTAGLVTLEDMLEEIVGEIYDEKDQKTVEIEKIGDNSFLMDGGINIDDAFEGMEYDPPADFDCHYTTVGGWATEVLDRFPKSGDDFEYDKLKVTVLSVGNMFVKTLRIDKTPDEDED